MGAGLSGAFAVVVAVAVVVVAGGSQRYGGGQGKEGEEERLGLHGGLAVG